MEGAHEKGGVEGEIGRFRRRHLTPIPHVGSLEALNAALAAADARDDARRIAGRTETVGEAAARELAVAAAAAGRAVRCGVAAVVPGRREGPDLCPPVLLLGAGPLRRPPPGGAAGRHHAHRLDGATIVAEHPRSLHKYSEDLVLDHYLEVLCRKPGALAGSTALAAARAAGVFTADHQRFWETARRRLGDGPGTRALIGVLLLHRTLPAEAVIAGMNAALSLDSCDPDLVAVEARRASHPEPPQPVIVPPGQRSSVTGPRRSLAGYDQLLAGALA